MFRKVDPGRLAILFLPALLAISICVPSVLCAQSNPVPFINLPLMPTAVAPGGPAFTLTVNGTGFVSGSVVNWNGQALTTHFVAASQLTATVPASDVATAGTASLTVSSPPPGGGTSNGAYFQVSPAVSIFGFGGPQIPTSQFCSAAAADLNGDGKPDLVTTDCNSSATIMLGKGDGTFQPGVAYPVGQAIVRNATAADVNGDGKIDIVVEGEAANGQGVLSVLLGNGDGTFEPSRDTTFNFGVGSDPLTLAVGDFNRDGKLDVAIADAAYGAVFLLLGNGDGTFQVPSQLSLTMEVDSITAGDFNKDGKLDLAVGLFSPGSTVLAVLLGNGDGTFQPPVNYAAPVELALAAADFNGDGNLDLVGIDSLGSQAVILLGNGDGTFQAPQSFATGVSPVKLAPGDFNADGKLDLMVLNQCGTLLCSGPTSGATISVFVGKGDGTFQPRFDLPAGPDSYSMAAADFNGDGKLDLAVGLFAFVPLLQTSAVLAPGTLNYAPQDVGTSSPAQTVTLTNAGANTVNISGISFAGSNPADFAQTNTCSNSLGPGASCAFSVIFAPTAQGARSALLTVSDDATGSPQQALLTGTGVAPIAALSLTSLTFPPTVPGTVSKPQGLFLSNSGNGTLLISSIAVSGDFRQVNNCGSSLAPNTNCLITVQFKPKAAGKRPGTLTVTDNAMGSPQTANLIGTGNVFLLSTAILAFGNQAVGTTSNPMTVTLTNRAPIAKALVSVRIAVGDAGDFSQTNNCGSSVPAGGTCTFSVTFTPSKKGSRLSQLQIDGGGSQQNVTLDGNGT